MSSAFRTMILSQRKLNEVKQNKIKQNDLTAYATSWSRKEKHNLQKETKNLEVVWYSERWLLPAQMMGCPTEASRLRGSQPLSSSEFSCFHQAQLSSYSNQAWTFTAQSFTEPVCQPFKVDDPMGKEPKRRREHSSKHHPMFSTCVLHLRLTDTPGNYLQAYALQKCNTIC